jgi:hypothetical protein
MRSITGQRKLLHGIPGLILILVFLAFGGMTFALHNQDGVHDPSAIIKCDDTYWIYGTGRGPHAMYSTDLVHWTEGQTPLPKGKFVVIED